MDAIITRNEIVDRPGKDWENNIGRSVVDDKKVHNKLVIND